MPVGKKGKVFNYIYDKIIIIITKITFSSLLMDPAIIHAIEASNEPPPKTNVRIGQSSQTIARESGKFRPFFLFIFMKLKFK
jgi:hypothetical protein